jgi:cysteinyl-tRNA synthetase
MTIDILRRVLEDYFGYDVTFVMNITDVDDKIVLRARRNHLLKKYQEEASDIRQVQCGAALLNVCSCDAGV